MKQFLQQCAALSDSLQHLDSRQAPHRALQQNRDLARCSQSVAEQLHQCFEVYRPAEPTAPHTAPRPLKAVTYNLERGKHLDAILQVLRATAALNHADFYFFTEVDWGMARTDNRNVAGEIGKALGMHAYFAPSYFNLTKGHGTERHLPGKNELGLHGKAILSRYPLTNLRVVPLPNATDKLRSKESRLGQKRALLGDLAWNGKSLTLVCAHLDAFSSPRDRAAQLAEAVKAVSDLNHVLIAGDWNTNTLNTCSSRSVLLSLFKQITLTRPQPMIRNHFPFPEKKYDRPLFEMLKRFGFAFEDFNELGAGTFDLFTNDRELGQMANDQYPLWLIKWINRLVENSGGLITLKLDWFAAKGLTPRQSQVLKLKPKADFDPGRRPSDHHPAVLSFEF